MLRVLVACEYSGVVRRAFTALGADAWSCDLHVPAEDDSPKHIRGDARELLGDGWDLLIAHPPCTYLCRLSATALYIGGKKSNGICPERPEKMRRGAALFRDFMDAPIPHVCVENPYPLRAAQQLIGRRWDQVVHPYQFGHDGISKATCLWLKGLPPLTPATPDNEKPSTCWVNSITSSRWQTRSRTFEGIATAMANQWTRHIRRKLVDLLDD